MNFIEFIREHCFMENKKLKLYKHVMWDKPARRPAQTILEPTSVYTIGNMKVFLFNIDSNSGNTERP